MMKSWIPSLQTAGRGSESHWLPLEAIAQLVEQRSQGRFVYFSGSLFFIGDDEDASYFYHKKKYWRRLFLPGDSLLQPGPLLGPGIQETGL
jgi:hypothetical protein